MACTTSSGIPALVIVASSVTLQAFHSPDTERHPVQLLDSDMAEEATTWYLQLRVHKANAVIQGALEKLVA
ncbi:uncharacterized protein SEPMUDRAFT_117034 [Sphaerulina musiva SO2202]|uniref:Uncharacterized protein n=1 Tax=Sphaerulina musiva (strain SO2202) TaxID=692275 RepID=M3D3H5_SPHMS|nr:uncharacterized protein SEPMUDRAFT_117034 [Sphaerulina musiva SO2202]EMF12444.1 hypothetical protein SEPMUDRAFT_117034 [Sphaerulina musiva SO2202]